MKLIKVYYAEGKYQTCNWNAEKTYKYVFQLGNNYIESGCFIHFANEEMTHYSEHVIELSSSIGCAMKCAFCASSEIKNIRTLTAHEIFDMFYYIYQDQVQQFSKPPKLMISFLGIGDLFYTMDSVLSAMEMIFKIDNNILFNLSSCFWTQEMLNKLKLSGLENNSKTIQATYVVSKNEIVRNLIRGLPTVTYDFQKIITNMVNTFTQRIIRINYLVIRGVNDSTEDFYMFANILKDINTRVIVRISKLNSTTAANTNNLLPSDIPKMTELMEILENNNIEAYLFYSYQDDKMNCGQLITECMYPTE